MPKSPDQSQMLGARYYKRFNDAGVSQQVVCILRCEPNPISSADPLRRSALQVLGKVS